MTNNDTTPRNVSYKEVQESQGRSEEMAKKKQKSRETANSGEDVRGSKPETNQVTTIDWPKVSGLSPETGFSKEGKLSRNMEGGNGKKK